MVFKRKLKDLFTLTSSNISASLILSLFWLFIASIMEKPEYGELGFLMSIANVGAAFALFGLRSTVVVYESKKENVFPASFVLVLITASFAAAISFVFTQNLMVSFLIYGMAIFRIILSGINSQQRFKDFAIHILLRAGSTLVLAIILFYILGINGIILGYFIATLPSLRSLPGLLRNKKVEFSVLKSKIGFMLPAYGIRLSDVFVKWGDKIVIGILFDFGLLGSYILAVQYLMLLEALPQAVTIYLTPQEARGQKNKKIKIFTVLISVLITLLSIALVPYGIETLLPQYAESILPMQVLSISLIPFTIISIQKSEFMGKENSKIVLLGNIIQSVSYFVLIILMGINFGIIGIAVGFVISVIARVIFNFFVRTKSKKLNL